MTEPGTELTCHRHPDRPTGLRCTSCGRPMCVECAVDASVGQRCVTCVRAQGGQRVVRARDVRSASMWTRAPLTMAIVAVTVGIFLLRFAGGQLYEELFVQLVLSNRLVALGEWYRMVSVVLLHADITHIFFNMFALYSLGPQIEMELGRARLAALYVASAAVGSAFAFHLGDISDVAVGASGAIFGLFGVWLASAIRRRNTRFGQAMLRQFGFLLLINAAIPLFIPSVSWQAHLGGLIAGLVIGVVWDRFRGSAALAVHVGVTLALGVAAIVSTQFLF